MFGSENSKERKKRCKEKYFFFVWFDYEKYKKDIIKINLKFIYFKLFNLYIIKKSEMSIKIFKNNLLILNFILFFIFFIHIFL